MATHARTKVVNGRQVFRGSWRFNPGVDALIRMRARGEVCHVFCGSSRIGAVRVDHILGLEANVLGDAGALPFPDASFDTIVADPPWNINPPDRWAYFQEARRISRPGALLLHIAPWLPPPWWNVDEVFIVPPRSTIHNCCLLACGELLPRGEQTGRLELEENRA